MTSFFSQFIEAKNLSADVGFISAKISQSVNVTDQTDGHWRDRLPDRRTPT